MCCREFKPLECHTNLSSLIAKGGTEKEEACTSTEVQSTYLARAIQEQQFYRIRELLVQKARNSGTVKVGVISTFYPSSKKCSRCGNIKKDLKLSDRIYKCDHCNLQIDRDLNAAINIRDCKDFKLI